MTDEIWDIAPKLDLLSAIEADDWTAHGAITELIANSFGEGRGNARVATVRWDPKTRDLMVLDNGSGMQDVRDLLQLGQGRGVSHRDIGKWGYGGTKALIWLGSEIHIYTLRSDRMMSSVAVNWATIRRSGKWEVNGKPWTASSLRWTPSELLENEHGTLIRLKVRREKRFHPSRIQEDLARTFAPGLRTDRHIVWETVRAADRIERQTLTTAQRGHWQTFELSMLIRGRELSATLYAGLDETLKASDTALEICFGPQVIKRTRECFKSPDGSEEYNPSTLRAWVDLGEGWQDGYLTNTKTGIADAEAEEILNASLFKALRPILQSIQDDAQKVALANIEANLARHLGGLLDVDVPAAPLARSPDYHWLKPEVPSGIEVPEIMLKRQPDAGVDEGETATRKERQSAWINAHFVSPEKQEGLLYKVSIVGNNVRVDLDESNYYCQRARSHDSPECEEMLALLVVPAVVDELVTNDVHAKRLLRPSVYSNLQDLDEDTRRAWLLRLLLDRDKGAA